MGDSSRTGVETATKRTSSRSPATPCCGRSSHWRAACQDASYASATRPLNGLGIALCDARAPDLQTVGGSLQTDAAAGTFPGESRTRRGVCVGRACRRRSRSGRLHGVPRRAGDGLGGVACPPRTRSCCLASSVASSLLRLHGALRPGRAGAARERPVQRRRAVVAAPGGTRRRGVRRTARRDRGRHPVRGAQLRTRRPERRRPRRRQGSCPLLGLARP